MKKNKIMRLASVLLVLTLLSTSVISGTFAKYVTTDEQFDTARVAKFGVVASLSGDLFGATYAKADDNSIISYSVNGGTVSSADKTEFVVAPGTENKEGLTLSVTGTPEVATKVIFDSAENEGGTNYKNYNIFLNPGTYGYMVPYTGELTKENTGNFYKKSNSDAFKGDFVKITDNTDPDKLTGVTVYELLGEVVVQDSGYYPLKWTVKIDGKSKTVNTVEDVTSALKQYFDETYTPNADNAMKAVVTWAWGYNSAWEDVAGTAERTIQEDLMDTILGNMMAQYKDKDAAGFEVVKLYSTNNNVYLAVQFKELDGANKTIRAITTKDGEKTVAGLTVAFNARLTVEQVD